MLFRGMEVLGEVYILLLKTLLGIVVGRGS